ncbi:MAG: type II secretion system F family protein [Candidatus Aminicenantes bacterium]|nr:type II secretion system F family protein [Candidatus Aminicenantes bacterium]
MPTYIWKGKNRYGDAVAGERLAGSADELTRILQKEQIQIASISLQRSGLKFLHLGERVKPKELAIYSRQLAVLIDAELPLIQSLNILAEQTRNKYFKKVIKSVGEDVEAGSSLNQAKRKFPKVFDDLFCNLVASGEQSGSLDTMLKRLADFIEKMVKLRSQVRQAMVYPAAIITFALIVAVFLLWKVIPIFGSIFAELGARLPGITRGVLSLSGFIQSYIVYMVLAIVAGIFLFRYYRKTTAGRWSVDRAALRIPILGKILAKVAISRVTRTLSTLLSGGVSMLECLKITSTTAGNVILEKAVMDARRTVAEGRSLTESFQATGRFPFMMIQMVKVGEETGTLDQMLGRLADFYDDEVSSSVAMLMSLLEPIMMIFVGGIVGGLILAMYLPMFSLMAQIQ